MTLRFIIQKEVLLKLLMHVRCPFKNNNTVQFLKMILVYRKKRQQQKFKKWFLQKKREPILLNEFRYQSVHVPAAQNHRQTSEGCSWFTEKQIIVGVCLGQVCIGGMAFIFSYYGNGSTLSHRLLVRPVITNVRSALLTLW